MKKRMAVLLLAICLAVSAAVINTSAEDTGVEWLKETRARLHVGNPTALRGRFFTTMWGGTTSDLDVQDLLHGYSPVRYDLDMGIFRFDHSVLQDATTLDDTEGNRTYILVFYDDLKWSDGTPITAYDYAFSILFCMDPAIEETGGRPKDYSWIEGAEAYLNGESETLSGLRVMSDQILQIRIKAEALPYYYELSRLVIHPYPVSVIAPGNSVTDDGSGTRMVEKLTADTIRETVLDPEKGYLTHPTIVSGPYTLLSFDGVTGTFDINPNYKGTEEGEIPRIGELEYTLAKNDNMIELLDKGELELLNKVTMSETIQEGFQDLEAKGYTYTAESYARTGLTLLWFMESSPKVQDAAVRRAIAYCFDRRSFIADYTGSYGIQVDGFYGIGQWMYRLAAGITAISADEDMPEEEDATGAFDELNLDGLTRYEFDTEKAADLLDAAGWRKGTEGIRTKKTGDGQTDLRMTLGYPESEKISAYLEEHLTAHLAEIGIQVTMQPMTMEEIEKAYRGETGAVDLLYLGENFSILFNPEILAPAEEAGPDTDAESSLHAAKAEVYQLALEMVRTEPKDTAGFLQKWIAMQERITETLPLLPVYSNVYFDFYTRALHDYRITEAVTWGEAIVKSYMSDIEMLTDDDGEILTNPKKPREKIINTEITIYHYLQ